MSDPEGVELDDLRAAHRHAVKLIRADGRSLPLGAGMPGNGVQVVDVEQGWSVLTVLFPVAEHDVRRGAEPLDAIV